MITCSKIPWPYQKIFYSQIGGKKFLTYGQLKSFNGEQCQNYGQIVKNFIWEDTKISFYAVFSHIGI